MRPPLSKKNLHSGNDHGLVAAGGFHAAVGEEGHFGGGSGGDMRLIPHPELRPSFEDNLPGFRLEDGRFRVPIRSGFAAIVDQAHDHVALGLGEFQARLVFLHVGDEGIAGQVKPLVLHDDIALKDNAALVHVKVCLRIGRDEQVAGCRGDFEGGAGLVGPLRDEFIRRWWEIKRIGNRAGG